MRLNTFGRPYVTHGGQEEVALQPLPLAVLAYLAMGGPRDRDHLANMFWPNNKNALNSLSTTLNRIRAEVPGGIWVRGNTLVGTDLPSDVGDLRAAFDRSDFESVTKAYSAPFLDGLKLRRQGAEFEEWVLDARTTLASMVELTLLQQGRDLFDAGEYRAAATAVEEAWEIAIRDGFPSPDYFDTYHRILASASRPTANAVRTMAEEFGIALRPVEPVVLESDGEPKEPGAPVPFAGESPAAIAAATQLFGCQEELAAIASSVAAHRLTTVIGLGGSGKTRLAAEFFTSSDVERDFPHRYWVNLRDTADHNLVAPAIAAALGKRFDDVASLADRLADDQPALLVLDNFEHVVDATAVVKELVDGNELVQILATSRVPLEVGDESLVQLVGLDTSDETHSPAARLFMSSARRAGVGEDRLSSSSRAAIHDVCRKVAGNPLALEIIGGWTRILSPPEILDALSRGNELLSSPMVSDLRAMDSVLKQSWATLEETDQNTLMLLATFPSGVLTKEALELRELPITSIGRLVQHSLVRQHVEGRITLHPLIAGHALSELEQRPDRQQEFHQILSNWCQSFTASVRSNSNRTHSRAFAAEMPNFASAWSWDARHGLWELHQATLGPLRQYFTESGRISEGRALFAAAAEALRSGSDADQNLLAAVLEAVGWFQMLSGDVTQARTLLNEALTLSSEDNRQGRAQILRTLGALQLLTGEVDEATANFNDGLALVGDEPGPLAATLQYDLAQAHHYRGARDQATKAARLALNAGRSTDDWVVVVRSYLLLADIEVEADPQRAVVLLNEGWVIAKEATLDYLAIYFPHILGLAHLNLHEAQLAESYFTEGMEAATKIGQLSTVCANHVGRGEARLILDRIDDAIEDLTAAIRLAVKTDSGRYLMWAAVVSCQASAARHAPNTPTRELLSLTLAHPAADHDARDKAARTWRALFDEDPPPVPDSATDGEAASLDEIAERSLGLLTLR